MEQEHETGGPVSVGDRLRAAGLSPERIQRHLEAGAIRLDDVAVTDLEQPAPSPARLVIAPT